MSRYPCPRWLAIIVACVVLPWGWLGNTGLAQSFDWQQIPGGRYAALAASPPAKPGFKKMELTGVDFTNALPPDRVIENQIRYNGSGVTAGDVDGDGLCDLFFCSLEGRSHLYKNLGNWKFVEITEAAGVSCTGLFTSGAVLADMDGDGDLDLLVNAYGGGTRLFLNDGRGHFTEKAGSGLLQRFGASSMALADIDGNGTLDLYVANYATTTLADSPGTKFDVRRINGRLQVVAVNGVSVAATPELQNKYIVDESNGSIKQLGEPHVLYRNKGNGVFEALSWTGGQFLDESGKPLTRPFFDWGLSAMFRDFNGDGAPDLYVCNDLFSPDRVWTNSGNGVFRAASNFAVRHMSDTSMGVDFADINRDGFDDLLVLDMLSRSHQLRAVHVLGMHRDISTPGGIDNRPPYNRNTLFLGRGDGTFAEIAQYSRIEASDWSWLPIFLDVDLDGYEDVLITTGYFRDSINADLQSGFEREKRGKTLSPKERLELQFRFYPLYRQANLAFRNLGNLKFEEAGDQWGFNEIGISQGMCLADLDNDGDLDVVVNNFAAAPTLYRNLCAEPRVAVRLKGLPPNTRGIGVKILFRGGLVPQSQEMICGGRFLSGDDAERVFAAGKSSGPCSIEVSWRSGRHSVLTNLPPNCVCEVDEARAAASSPMVRTQSAPIFRDVSQLLAHTHRETPFDDFTRQPLLPRKLSQAGPGVNWVDVNGDGRPDLLVGGGRGGGLDVLVNDGAGPFRRQAAPASLTALATEQGAIVGFASSNGAVIVCAQSNYEGPATNSAWQLGIDAGGTRVVGRLATQESCPGAMAMADVDGDGPLDLFIGGRVVPGKYPAPASSTLWKGQGDGSFVLAPESASALKEVGLVNGAVFSDLDGDGWPDLVLAVEWGPVRVFHNDHERLKEITKALGLDKFTGWWNGVTTGDFDGDGRMDIAASNWGQNTRYERYRAEPVRIYFGDWNGNGGIDLLEAMTDPALGKIVAVKGFDPVRRALPWVAGEFTSYAAYGAASVGEILGQHYADSRHLEATTLESMVFLNRGDHFEPRPLPAEAQFAPAFGITVADFDGDGFEDIFLAQNFYPVDPEGSRYDAGRGLWLKGDGGGNFSAVPGQVSGVEVYGDQRGAALCDYDGDGRVDLALAQNGGPTKLYHNEGGKAGVRVVLAGEAGNPAAFGAQMRLVYGDRHGPMREVHGGSGYWSQDGAVQILGKGESTPTQLWVRWPGGGSMSYRLPQSAKEIVAHPSGTSEVK